MKRKNEEVKILTSPLAGEDARRAGEGDIKKSPYFTPSLVCSDFVRQTTSPARGEVTQRAFTLIELLVVVLIIGILAAVAVPQYQKAVEKSKAAQALTLLKALHQAATEYHMANGTYPTKFDELSVEVPWTGNKKWSTISFITDTRSNGEWSLQLYSATDGHLFYMGRLTGKYKGAGFSISHHYEPRGVPLCAERTSSGVIFEEPAGSYCERLMKGSLKNTYGTYRSYNL